MLRYACLTLSMAINLGVVRAEEGDLQAAGAASGTWVDLFVNDSLDGWTTDDGAPVTRGWRVEKGVLIHSGRSGNIVTRRQFSDFELAFEWKLTPGTNSGIKYRLKEYSHRRLGCEYQLIDGAGYKYPLARWQFTGGIYGLYPPPREPAPNRPGQWNTSRIVARGTHLEHWLNGQQLVSADTASDDWGQRVMRSKFSDYPDFGRNTRGPIMIQDHGGTVWFRRVAVRVLGE
ncbi:MAG: DUF1080 domain-containing protein [Pirellulales bacterium]